MAEIDFQPDVPSSAEIDFQADVPATFTREAEPARGGGYLEALQRNIRGAYEAGKQSEVDFMGTKVNMDPLGTTLGFLMSPLGAAGNVAGEAAGGGVPGAAVDVGVNIAGGVALGGTAQAGRRLMQKIAPRLPGASTALRNLGIKEAEGLAPSILPDVPSSQLFESLSLTNPQVPLGPIVKEARDIGKSSSLLRPQVDRLTALREDLKIVDTDLSYIAKEGPLANPHLYNQKLNQSNALRKQIADIEKSMTPSVATDEALQAQRNIVERVAHLQGRYPLSDSSDFKAVRDTMKDLNELIGQAKISGEAGGVPFGVLMKLKAGFWKGLEEASAQGQGPIYDALKKANMAYRREIASDTVDEIVFKNFGQQLEGTTALSSNAAAAHRQLSKAVKEDKFLKESFPEGELDRVLGVFQKISDLPVRPAPKGVNVGSMTVNRQGFVGGGLGGALGAAMGGPAGGAIGAGLGTAGAVGIPWAISKMLQTDTGSKLLINFIQTPGGLTPVKVAAMAAFIRGTTGENVQLGE